MLQLSMNKKLIILHRNLDNIISTQVADKVHILTQNFKLIIQHSM